MSGAILSLGNNTPYELLTFKGFVGSLDQEVVVAKNKLR